MARRVVMPGKCRLLLDENATVEQWLHARTQGIGGSEVAALVGESPYATSWDVWKAKVTDEGTMACLGEEPAPGPKVRPELLTDNRIFEVGHRAEQMVGLWTADRQGGIARPAGGLYQSIEHPLAIVTPDRILCRRRSWKPEALIECKTSGDPEPWDEDEAPLHYRIQAQWQMGVCGIKTCYLGCMVFNFDRDFFVVREDFDEEWYKELVAVAEKFWEEYVITGELPEHDYAHPRTVEILKEQHPHVKFEAIQLPPDAEAWVFTYLKARDAVKAANEYLDEAKTWLGFHLGDAAAGYLGDDKVVSWPEIHQHRISATLLREKYPEVAKECTVESTHRRMTVKKPKHKNTPHTGENSG